MTDVARSRLTEQLAQARTDLREVGEQVEAGDIDPAAAEKLEAVYRQEISSLEAELVALSSNAPQGTSRRILVGTAISLAAAVLIIGLAFQFVEPRSGGTALGLAAEEVDLEEISTDALEAVIAANSDHPQINGMRLALADRYFIEGDFRSALPHYQAVLESEPDGPDAAVAFARVGWMFYQSGGEPEVAVEYLREALNRAGDYSEAKLYLAVVYLYGLEDRNAAVPLLSELEAQSDLPAEIRSVVETALADARAGEP